MTTMEIPQLLQLDGLTGLGRDVLGGKAFSIEQMRRLGINVPPAFVLTTEVCRRYYEKNDGAPGVPVDVLGQLPAAMAHLEHATGRIFGSDDKPLLVSVRSGGSVSMPGMMDTVLNLGMNGDVERALARESGNEAYAKDTRRRFEEQFNSIVGQHPPTDPWEQLILAISAVFGSWQSPRAIAYRDRNGIDNSGGTAVTVQAMVFGNIDELSGTGVLFSRNPLAGDPAPYGEWLPKGQGEDVVSGRANALHLEALAAHLPEVHAKLISFAKKLESHDRDVQDVEFTVESGRLWLLQTRVAKRSPEAAVRHAVDMANEGLITRSEALDRVNPEQIEALMRLHIDPMVLAQASVVARGKAASPGIAVGTVVVDCDDALDRADEGEGVILARPTTDPDDVSAMSMSVAVVTEFGGSTSHAALVCREMAVPCVVGCGAETLMGLAGRTVTVDGASGLIYDGALDLVAFDQRSNVYLGALTDWAANEAGREAPLTELLRTRGCTAARPQVVAKNAEASGV